MRTSLAALLCGAIFGFGLCTAELVNPARIVGFLDVAGRWDATVVFVMASALVITFVGFPLVARRSRPLLADHFYLPTKRDLDLPLFAGSAMFGVGWGLSGLCPGPAITGLATLSPSIASFVVAMIAGQWIVGRLEAGRGALQRQAG